MPQPDFLSPVSASLSGLPPSLSERPRTGEASAGRCAGATRRPCASRRDFLTGVPSRRAPDDDYWIRVHRRAMACRFEITLASGDAASVPAARAALNEIDRIEDQLSVFRETSAISHLNRRAAHGSGRRRPGSARLAARVPRACRAPPVGPSTSRRHRSAGAGGFSPATGACPRGKRSTRPARWSGSTRSAWPAIDGARPTVRFERPGIELNLGAIGKGYALDRVARDLRSRRCRPRAPLSGLQQPARDRWPRCRLARDRRLAGPDAAAPTASSPTSGCAMPRSARAAPANSSSSPTAPATGT